MVVEEIDELKKNWAKIGRTRENLWRIRRVEGGSGTTMLGTHLRITRITPLQKDQAELQEVEEEYRR